jgi:formylglycine-generating enzyme required for sulfatase activity
MRKLFLSANAVFLAIFIAEATFSVSLTGTVIGTENRGITHAYVYLKSFPGLKTLTDAAGAFHLQGSAAQAGPRVAHSSLAPSIKNNRVLFKTEQTGKNIACELFASNGARIYLTQNKNLASGNHSILMPKAATGIYFIRLSIGNETCLMKAAFGMDLEFYKAAHVARNVLTNAHYLTKNASVAAIDTLVVVAMDYKNAMVDIIGYDQKNITVSLTASNPWRPSGALVHEQGMVKIKAKGHDFEMGQPDPDILHDTALFAKIEQPVHTVRFNHDFWMDTSEVTQRDYDSLMKATYPDFKGNYAEWNTQFGKGDAYPAYSVYWDDAALYCNARSKRDNLDTVYLYTAMEGIAGKMCFLFNVSIDTSKNGYRLPTEAQWEYACKAGGDYDYYWGKDYGPYPAAPEDSSEMSRYAVWSGNAWDLDLKANKVCQKKPNAYGLYDMSGNVNEWCTDYFESYTYGSQLDPALVTGDHLGAPEYMTAKGGSYGSATCYLRSASRLWYQDAFAMGYWYKFMGIRVVRPIKE